MWNVATSRDVLERKCRSCRRPYQQHDAKCRSCRPRGHTAVLL